MSSATVQVPEFQNLELELPTRKITAAALFRGAAWPRPPLPVPPCSAERLLRAPPRPKQPLAPPLRRLRQLVLPLATPPLPSRS